MSTPEKDVEHNFAHFVIDEEENIRINQLNTNFFEPRFDQQ